MALVDIDGEVFKQLKIFIEETNNKVDYPNIKITASKAIRLFLEEQSRAKIEALTVETEGEQGE